MSKTTYLIYLLLLCFCKFTYAQCNLNDWTALHQLYENTDGDNWLIKTNWNVVSGAAAPQNCDLSTLYGITLNSNNRVSVIELSENNLTGQIPATIANLLELNELLLNENNLNGSIPATIAALENLTVLELENNSLVGALPAEIGSLINLEVLVLNDNQLTGTIPASYGNLSGLTDLFLYGNQLSGCFDENLSALCGQFYYYDDISDGNNFDALWTNFCNTSEGQCSNCVPDLILTDNTSNAQTYQAGESITSTASLSAAVTYQAGLFILLDEGFCSAAAHDFNIDIEGCN